MATGRRVTGDVLKWITRLHREEGWSPKQIHQKISETIEARIAKKETDAAARRNIPALRQVQRIVQDLTTRDLTAPWSLAEADVGEIRDVLDVLAAVVLKSEGRIKYVTTREASWIARIKHAVPTLEPLSVWHVAQDYMLREDARKDTADLDLSLAIAPALPDKKLSKQYGALHARLWPDRNFSPLADHDVAVKGYVSELTGSEWAGAAAAEVIRRRQRGEWPPKKSTKPTAKRQRRKGATK